MQKLQARLILEILGRPPEHVKETLKLLLDKLGREKGIKITDSRINDPIPVPESKDLFTTFAEVYVELESLDNYFGIIFAYMPANIEIIQPEEVTLSSTDLNQLGNKLIQRLHEYDSIAKRMISEKEFLVTKLREFAPHLFKTNEKVPDTKKTNAPKKSKKSKKKN